MTTTEALTAAKALTAILREEAHQAWAAYDAIEIITVSAPAPDATDEEWDAYNTLQRPKSEAWTAYGDIRAALVASYAVEDALLVIRDKEVAAVINAHAAPTTEVKA